MKLQTKFDGLVLKNPLMPASGPLTGDYEKLKFMQQQGVGAVVTKTISTIKALVPRPCIFGGREYIMNCELWSEYEKEIWINEFLPQFKKISTSPLIVSVGYRHKLKNYFRNG